MKKYIVLFLVMKLKCKCDELKAWLKKEILHLEKIKKDISQGSNLYHIVDAKILSYSIVLDGLNS